MVSLEVQVVGSHSLVVEVVTGEDSLRIRLEGCSAISKVVDHKRRIQDLRVLVLLHRISLWPRAVTGRRPVALWWRSVALWWWCAIIGLLLRVTTVLLAALILLARKERHGSTSQDRPLQAVDSKGDSLYFADRTAAQGFGGVRG